MPYRFDAELWTMSDGRWHMLTVPEKDSDEIDERTAGLQGGFGSVKVEVTIGTSTWTTSVFPSQERGQRRPGGLDDQHRHQLLGVR